MTIKIYQVGGSVRDELLGVSSKDLDYSVEAESFDAMRNFLVDNGFKIFVESPQFLTIRARKDKEVSDFVLCRKDGEYTDGRRPDTVTPGTIYDDLARRDFTINAIAKDIHGNILDPHDGRRDLGLRLIRTVGDPQERFGEDALRMLRALRFSITKDFFIHSDTSEAIHRLSHTISAVSVERQREELHKMFKHNTLRSMLLLTKYPVLMGEVFRENLWLKPTTEG